MPSDFLTTQWSVVLRAGREGSDADRALAQLCERYWFPLYAFVRRSRGNKREAQDLTQEFFARLLENKLVASATRERGRFRSFLITSLKNFLNNEWDRARAAKRGGKAKHFSFDFNDGETRLTREPAHTLTPERLFDRDWATRLLELVIQKLEREYDQAGKQKQFAVLKDFLRGEGSADGYAGAATELGQTENAVRQAAHRLRKRYRELLKEEVAQTLDDPSKVDDELRELFDALG